MLQVAAPIWNRIADSQKLRTSWAKRLFALNQEQLNAQQERQAASLARRRSRVSDEGVSTSRPAAGGGQSHQPGHNGNGEYGPAVSAARGDES